MAGRSEFPLNPRTYEWAVRSFTLVKRVLGVNLKLHQSGNQVAEGDIFLFNHFARFETFIPQYFLYKESGAFCRSVATHHLFKEGDGFSAFLVQIGAVPNNYPRLLPFLAAEILRGRKVIIFPEGGMIKDRQVVDKRGRHSIYSRKTQTRRKAHTGAAVLATLLAAYKHAIYRRLQAQRYAQLERWAEQLGIESAEKLVQVAQRPTTIIPANITFYPIRVDDNLLKRGVGLLNKNLSPKATEELIIEGNIILKDTDMDIRLGEPVRPAENWGWWERWVIANLTRDFETLDDLFTEQAGRRYSLMTKLCDVGLRRSVERLRDLYMTRMYQGVTINMSHLASSLILELIGAKRTEIPRPAFQRLLYLTIKALQEQADVRLHRGLRYPERYETVLEGDCPGLEQFLRTTTSMGLLAVERDTLRFLPKLRGQHDFDAIRLENLIAVYANEAMPIRAVRNAVRKAITGQDKINAEKLAHLRFDDSMRSYECDRTFYHLPQHDEINAQETATESGQPYFIVPRSDRDLGVLLVHGFLASPAELRALAERLAERGHPVLGVRLKGHGTSPWDLRDRSWEEWLASVEQGYRILSGVADRIVVIGFSTGAALALVHAARRPHALAGVAAVSTPVKFRNRNMIFVPLVQHATRFIRKVSPYDAVFPFRQNESEHPHINYRNIPIRGLYELGRLVDTLLDRCGEVSCPTYLLQGSADRVVDPKSADLLYERLGTSAKAIDIIESDRHGILNENIGNAQELVLAFVESIDQTGRLPAQDLSWTEGPVTQPPPSVTDRTS